MLKMRQNSQKSLISRKNLEKLMI